MSTTNEVGKPGISDLMRATASEKELRDHISLLRRLTRVLKAKKNVFTGKIAYLVYILISVLIILFVKYKLDVLRDEHNYEMRHVQSEDRLIDY